MSATNSAFSLTNNETRVLTPNNQIPNTVDFTPSFAPNMMRNTLGKSSVMKQSVTSINMEPLLRQSHSLVAKQQPKQHFTQKNSFMANVNNSVASINKTFPLIKGLQTLICTASMKTLDMDSNMNLNANDNISNVVSVVSSAEKFEENHVIYSDRKEDTNLYEKSKPNFNQNNLAVHSNGSLYVPSEENCNLHN